MFLTSILTLLRLVRAVPKSSPASKTSPGPAGSELRLEKPAGMARLTGKVERPETYPRRQYATRSWERPGGQSWQWQADGRLKMRTLELEYATDSLIPVIPPHVVLPLDQQRIAWNAFAPIQAGRSPFTKLFAGKSV